MGVRLLPKSSIVRRHRMFIEKMQYTLQRWEAFPSQRRQTEEIIQSRLECRVSVASSKAAAGSSSQGQAGHLPTSRARSSARVCGRLDTQLTP